MNITFEQDELGQSVKVTTYPSGAVTRELDRPALVPVPAVPGTRITRLAFMNRLTDAEAVAIDLASLGATVPAASMRRFQKKVDNATFIDLARANVIAGINSLVAAGFLTAPRGVAILTNTVQAEEVPA